MSYCLLKIILGIPPKGLYNNSKSTDFLKIELEIRTGKSFSLTLFQCSGTPSKVIADLNC